MAPLKLSATLAPKLARAAARVVAAAAVLLPPTPLAAARPSAAAPALELCSVWAALLARTRKALLERRSQTEMALDRLGFMVQVTRTVKVNGPKTYLLAVMTLGLALGFDDAKSTLHYCSSCSAQLGKVEFDF